MDDLLDLNFSSPSSSTVPTLKPTPNYARTSSALNNSALPPRTASPATTSSFDFLSALPPGSSGTGVRRNHPPNGAGSLTPTPVRSNTPISAQVGNETSNSGLNEYASGKGVRATGVGTNANGNSKDVFADLLFGHSPMGSQSLDPSPTPAYANKLPIPRSPINPSSSTTTSGRSTPFTTYPTSAPPSSPAIKSHGIPTLPSANLTLAQQRARIESQRKEKEAKDRAAFDFDAWGRGAGGTGDPADLGGTANPQPAANDSGNTPFRANSSARPRDTRPASIDVFDLLSDNSMHHPATLAAAPSPAPPKANGFSRSGARSSPASNQDRDQAAEDILGLLGRPPAEIVPRAKTSDRGGAVARNGDASHGESGSHGRNGSDGWDQEASTRPRSPHRILPRPSTSTLPNRTTPNVRSSSPPPHILGRIVEMGFSPAQARKALARTEGGLDVEAAMEILLGGEGSTNGGWSGNGHISANGTRGGNDGERDQEFPDPEEEAMERRRRRRQGPSRAGLSADASNADNSSTERNARFNMDDEILAGRSGGSSTPTNGADVIVDQADKILSQASEIGLSMFNKANTLWSVGKERAKVMYEERAAAGTPGGNKQSGGGLSSGSAARQDGRPRWMVDAQQSERVAREDSGKSRWRGSADNGDAEKRSGAFRDSDDEEEPPETVLPQRPTNGRAKMDRRTEPESPPPLARAAYAQSPHNTSGRAARPTDLLSKGANANGSGYKSPSRHRTVSPEERRRPPPVVATKPALRVRPLAPVTADQVRRSLALKTEGNDHFKLGRFAEASTSYSAAISALPSQHILAIPLYNNRATSLLKSGDHSGAVSDCTIVIKLVGPSYHPAKEAPLSGDVAEIKLADALFKALSRRAGAFEAGEKWDKAKDDWETLMTLPAAEYIFAGPGGASQRRTVSDGLARSRKMCAVVQGDHGDGERAPTNQAKPQPTSRPKAKVAPAVSAITLADQSGRRSKLREAAADAEREDDLRFSLKSSVDARLSAWSKGKEANIRGLLSSLDMVLWDGLGLKEVGMGDLLTEKQVKIAYMRVIAKLHPDKLRVGDTTLEQRMLANGAFGTLNEAWKAFLSTT